MVSASSILALVIYILLGRFLVRRGAGTWREIAFVFLNLAGFYYCFCWGRPAHNAVAFGFYIGAVLFQFLMLLWFAEKPGASAWLAFFTPLLFLFLVRYVLVTSNPKASGLESVFRTAFFVGISYQAFRCSRLVLEVRNGQVKRPNGWEYLNFAFFLPTMSVGPINSYANFRCGFDATPYEVPAGRAVLRILVGFVKYQLLCNYFGQLGYANLLVLDEHLHPWTDLPVAMIFYYLFLYCNFSGFCDMAIGAAGLIGIPVSENFNNPFAARNVKDFWNRWHITLSVWMRDVVFSPLSKFLVGKFGLPLANHAIALTITVVFLLVGIWHGVGWNFVAFGAAHALGVVVNHYYTIFLKKRLGRDGFKAYNENRWIHATAVVLTFSYVAASLLLFANTFPEMKQIFLSLR